MKINFALLFDELTSSQCEHLSLEFAQNYKSSFVLGANCLPHVTILQIDCEELDISILWEKARSLIQQSYDLNFAGLTFIPSSGGATWIEIQVLKSQVILNLQKSLLELDILKGKKIFNGVMDQFRPHVTVALIDGPVEKIPLPHSLLRKTGIVSSPSIGLVGQNFIYTKTIFPP